MTGSAGRGAARQGGVQALAAHATGRCTTCGAASQVFTIEPMVNLGTWRDVLWPDGWTAVTADGQRSAQFEHQIVITATGADVLTARLPTSPPLWWEE